MEYKQYSLAGYKINICIDDIANLRLLQSDSKYPLSQFIYKGKKPKAIINCSYFTNDYVIGRNQGDMSQGTSSFADKGWLGFALQENLSYIAGKLDWWDVEKSVCGFTPSTINILDGKDVQLYTIEFNSSFDADMKDTRCQSIFGILNDKSTCLLVTAEKGLTGYQVVNYLKNKYNFDFLCCLDNGGSSEMIVNGNIKQKSLDGSERKMFNGLAFVEEQEKQDEFDLMFPCADGWGSQEFHSKDTIRDAHYGIDIGWLKAFSKDGKTNVLACYDGEVVHAGVYPQYINNKRYEPIGVILKHSIGNAYDYYSIYWHLDSVSVKVGDKVSKGQKVGVRGNTGYSSGVHLHFQMMKIEKGAKLPSYTEWSKYSFDPVPYINVYDDIQTFDDASVYVLNHVKKGVTSDNNMCDLELQIDLLNAELKERDKTILTLKDMNRTLDDANKSLREENEILQEKIDNIKEIINE